MAYTAVGMYAGQSTPGYQTLVDFVCMLRRIGQEYGKEDAIARCQQEGRFLAGFAIFCHPCHDKDDVAAMVEAAGGTWLDKEPDSNFMSAVPTLVFSALEDNSAYQHAVGIGPAETMWTPPAANMVNFGMQMSGSPGMMLLAPGGPPPGRSPSSDAYLETSLRPEDVDGYSAAGLQLYRRTEAGPELLLLLEQPWNSFEDKYDPLSWNVLGTRRARGGWESEPEQTAVRCTLEILGGIQDAPPPDTVLRMCSNSVAVWYPRGKYALFLHEAKGGALELFENPSLSERFSHAKGKPRVDPWQPATKYPKLVEGLEWVPAEDLLKSKTRMPLADLLENFCMIRGFKDFLERGVLPPAREAEPSTKAGKGKGKSMSKDKGSPDSWDGDEKNFGKGKSAKDKGSKGSGKGGGKWDQGPGPGFESKGKGKHWNDGPGSTWDPGVTCKGKGKKDYGDFNFGGKMDKGKGKYDHPDSGGKGMDGRDKGYGGKDKSTGKGGGLPSPQEMTKQVMGEQIYVKVQSIVTPMKFKEVPPFLVAQKITGMLLELPRAELIILLEESRLGLEELKDRVSEALEILKEEGFV